MRTIKDAIYMDYIFLFGEQRTTYSDYNVKNAFETDGNLYMMFEENTPIGYICCELLDGMCKISYAYVLAQERHKGIFTEMISYVVSHSDRPVKVNIAEDNQNYDCVRRVLLKHGFKMVSRCMVYSCEPKDYVKWAGYMEKTGKKLNEMLMRHGFSCTSFRDAPKSILNEIYNSENSDFANELPVKSFFDNPGRCMDLDMSFVAVKEERLAAYSLVSRPHEKCAVFEQTSVSEKYKGSGVIFLPFSKSMDSVETFHCTKASYAIYENNSHSNAFRKKVVDRVTSSKRYSENYIYRKEEK